MQVDEEELLDVKKNGFVIPKKKFGTIDVVDGKRMFSNKDVEYGLFQNCKNFHLQALFNIQIYKKHRIYIL